MTQIKFGRLFLLPSPIADNKIDTLSPISLEVMRHLSDFIVENERTARRFLSKIMPNEILDKAFFYILDEHTQISDVSTLLTPALQGRDIGLLSEAGCPCIADPGASLVAAAHKERLQVVPMPGPSSILLALMASGLNGQAYVFNGYLPQDKHERKKRLADLERESLLTGRSQIFIETPYRNQSLLEDAIAVLSSTTVLSVAIELTSDNESIQSMTIAKWREIKSTIPKVPTVFTLGGQQSHTQPKSTVRGKQGPVPR
jgi:16S rRNA (cytidine1402-2'-O)-methyltransferase